jgi:hypothetical protein
MTCHDRFPRTVWDLRRLISKPDVHGWPYKVDILSDYHVQA